MAFDGDLPAGVGVLTVNDGVGHINTAATLPQFRGRGVQGALIAHRIREGLKLGCTAFATETGLLSNQVNHSYNNMLRCAFHMAYERPNYLYRCPKA
jgi:GNAT superfamily N-acetyltransferase